MQTAPHSPENFHSQGADDFYPQILRDFEAGHVISMLASINHSTAILAEAGLFILDARGPAVLRRFLEAVKTYTPN